MKTLNDLFTAHDLELADHLLADVEVPALDVLQVQGDVAIIPTRMSMKEHGAGPVPAEGVPVVRGENGGNTHLLVADGAVTWSPATDWLDLGVVTVGEGATAFLLHPEHGANALAPGSYRLRRQREQAEEIRRVAD